MAKTGVTSGCDTPALETDVQKVVEKVLGHDSVCRTRNQPLTSAGSSRTDRDVVSRDSGWPPVSYDGSSISYELLHF